ncbi:MAG: hypothetical protein COZ07_10675 [Candidatus Infernicultor aquiphilus]|uniref:Uncharacterized protein n=1 Tax=Candidatus Infernicultor aquiphilus TaxID=1805029 RepID=A0A1J5GZA3_9BACT|nr:hypothetical protein [bacterium]OIP73134.1 MAG: hypothetical protein AUK42_01425 [Candidatus Atribacteria bacterium CG2_30_33_13]PIU25863.1 MAG: hypothetical protein COT11_00395 [Candidatus Atribacteria bacterium CG08_land_8_20_14_0_20_33_29]PIW12492.1 MAG: hypothetical protein COW35_01320 [Candidatus Atribacteria bacterium CG17_big_fil_post_rev_8_21_14_2_50_34_11]PIX35330.1 MAG: hypothetical protein COZ58_00385 [Candidatus Atribacteria bacterium CG_4_8_14_3_um_filter_34_18]PIY31054.1 MAG: 
MKRKIKGGILAIVGYILSPVSWWNDLFVNIPLAYVFALPFRFFSKKLFLPAMILGYWITNVIGFIMMHHGVKDVISKEKSKYTRKKLIKDILISIVYTGVVVIFVLKGWLKFPTEYFK